MGTDTTRYVDRDSMLDDILETQTLYGNHTLILYSDVADFRHLYLNYIKKTLQSLNEMVLMLPYYDTVIDIVNNLRSTGIDIDKYKKEGSLVIVQSEKAHYSLSQEFVGVMIMTKMLLRRLDKLGKAGITIISDMGLFFHRNKLEDLTKCEMELMSSVNNIKVKVWCCYNKSDFDMLSEPQMRQNLLKAHHHKIVNIPP
jgi:hypothetical protein